MTPTPIQQLLADLKASVSEHRARDGQPDPQPPRCEPPWTRDELAGLAAENRAERRRLGDPVQIDGGLWS